jgi:DNA-directed RNA polymerase specialized sigma24 family protein
MTLPAAGQYQALRRGEPSLARFDSVEALLAYFANEQTDLDDKDRIYATLVRTVQSRAPCARVAGAIAWCGLWPGLDRIYRRRVRHFEDDPDELTQVIWLAFTELMNRLDLAQVRRIAATIVRSTDREVRTARRRAAGQLGPSLATPIDLAALEERSRASETDDRSTSSLSFAGELADLRAQLVPLVGPDANLVVAALILEIDQRALAARMGLTYAAARKRVQRAVLRIRAQLPYTGGLERLGRPLDPLVNRSGPETDDDTE